MTAGWHLQSGKDSRMESVFIPPVFIATLIGGLTYILGRVSPSS